MWLPIAVTRGPFGYIELFLWVQRLRRCHGYCKDVATAAHPRYGWTLGPSGSLGSDHAKSTESQDFVPRGKCFSALVHNFRCRNPSRKRLATQVARTPRRLHRCRDAVPFGTRFPQILILAFIAQSDLKCTSVGPPYTPTKTARTFSSINPRQ